jgi:hypothetical protein
LVLKEYPGRLAGIMTPLSSSAVSGAKVPMGWLATRSRHCCRSILHEKHAGVRCAPFEKSYYRCLIPPPQNSTLSYEI